MHEQLRRRQQRALNDQRSARMHRVTQAAVCRLRRRRQSPQAPGWLPFKLFRGSASELRRSHWLVVRCLQGPEVVVQSGERGDEPADSAAEAVPLRALRCKGSANLHEAVGEAAQLRVARAACLKDPVPVEQHRRMPLLGRVGPGCKVPRVVPPRLSGLPLGWQRLRELLQMRVQLLHPAPQRLEPLHRLPVSPPALWRLLFSSLRLRRLEFGRPVCGGGGFGLACFSLGCCGEPTVYSLITLRHLEGGAHLLLHLLFQELRGFLHFGLLTG
mmetsp:Transcript_80908/g.262017  ORF Transcript_80908/g.262017 Transcript_80908/m.262017 type:complete len:272 (-) Transcript_80908:2061-2876(-)